MPIMVDNTYQPKVYETDGGNRLVVASGGTIDIQTGGTMTVDGADVTHAVAAGSVAGLAAGYKLARGEVTLDGTNPTPIATGLATVVAASVTLKSAVTPGDDPSWCSVDYGGGVTAGTINLYAWKNTGGTDPTLVASTNAAAVFSWIAVGT